MKTLKVHVQSLLLAVLVAVAVAAVSPALGQVPRDAARAYQLALELLKKGKHQQALRKLEEASRLVSSSIGERHKANLAILRLQASVLKKSGAYEKSLVVAERAQKILRQNSGRNNRSFAIGEINIGSTYFAMRQDANAIERFKAALEILGKIAPKNDALAGRTYLKLAAAQTRRALLIDAEQSAKRALAIHEAVYSKTDPNIGEALNTLGVIYDHMNRHDDAIRQFARQISILERARGAHHGGLVPPLGNMANLYHSLGNYDRADELQMRAIEIARKAYGESSVQYAVNLENSSSILINQGRLADAEHAAELAVKIYRKAKAAPANIATSVAALGRVYFAQGRLEKAEAQFIRSLAVAEEQLDRNHVDLARYLHGLAITYNSMGKLELAERFLRRALSKFEEIDARPNDSVANALRNLGLNLIAQNRREEARTFVARALQMWRQIPNARPDRLASALQSLGSLQISDDDAVRYHREALQVARKAYGSPHPSILFALSGLGGAFERKGDLRSAEVQLREALGIAEQLYGSKHPRTADIHKSLAHTLFRSGNPGKALPFARKAVSVIKQDPGKRALGQQSEKIRFEEKPGLSYPTSFELLISSLSALGGRSEPAELALGEAFEAAQSYGTSSTAAAVAQMAARFGAGDGALAARIREGQDLLSQRSAAEKALQEARSAAQADDKKTAIQNLRRRVDELTDRIERNQKQIKAEFPEYAELIKAATPKIADTQSLLGDDDALLFYFSGIQNLFIWAVTRDAVQWRKVSRTRAHFEEQISVLRKSLDPTNFGNTESRGFTREQVCRGFARSDQPCEAYDTDLARAHRLYTDLVGPVADVVEGKRHLIVVPSGPLTGLPFHMLVTAPPPNTGSLEDRFKHAEWLIRRYAVTVLPSVSSLRALRVSERRGRAKRPFVGFGNPDFFTPQDKSRPSARTRTVQGTRGYSAYLRGRLADVELLSGRIPPLPDTADELKAVGRVFKARKSEIVLGRQASETVIKKMSRGGKLDDYRIVHFATHGLIAGELEGLGEPALALSLPGKATENDDGLLTASEVAQLKLNADWVVLSACNTAAGEKPGAEAFSGLARAFFYSGTRALLVSHWPVISEAAVKLTTRTFSEMNGDPAIGRAEALRRSMLALIDKGAPYERHPAYWAPFVVVGDGAGSVR